MLTGGVCLLHDNARHHTDHGTQETSFRWDALGHPSHSPDLAPNDLHLFSKWKEHLAGNTFANDNEVQEMEAL